MSHANCINYSVFRRNGHNCDPCNSCLKAYFVLFLSSVSINSSGARQKFPLDMFKFYLRCHESPSLQKMILSRSVGHWIISGNTEIRFPARSTNEAPFEYCLWVIFEAEITSGESNSRPSKTSWRLWPTLWAPWTGLRPGEPWGHFSTAWSC